MEPYSIRKAIKPEDIYFRGGAVDPSQLTRIRTGLRKLHTFEIMAVNIYKFQITSQQDDFNQMIIQAMANEMAHVQDFQIKLYEYGGKPNPLRWAFWIVGMVIGLGSRLLGKKTILKAGIWTEQKAVTDYQKVIDSVQWDTETLAVIKQNMDDEYHHIETLQSLRKSL
jgi:ubiquinone biosynthesis monooxygenase Coq7